MANRKNKMERRYTNIIPSGIGKEDAKMSMNKLKIHKNMVRRETSRNQIEPNEGCLPELRPQIDFHDFLRQLSHDIRRIQAIG